MRNRFKPALRLGVARGGLALLRTSRWRGAPATLLAEHALAPDSVLDAAAIGQSMRALFEGAGLAGWPLSVVLADDLVRMWHVTPPAASTRLSDLEAACALRFQLLYGESAAAWQVSAGWDPDRPFLAAAIPRALLAALGDGAAAHGLPLVAVTPQFVASFNRWAGAHKPGAWFGVVHDKLLTLGACEGGALTAVRAEAVPEAADAAWLAAHLAREALRLNLPAPGRLQLCGAVPPAWLESSALECSLLGAAPDPHWSPVARLAASGSTS